MPFDCRGVFVSPNSNRQALLFFPFSLDGSDRRIGPHSCYVAAVRGFPVLKLEKPIYPSIPSADLVLFPEKSPDPARVALPLLAVAMKHDKRRYLAKLPQPLRRDQP